MASSSSLSSTKKSSELAADASFLEHNHHEGVQELHKSQLLRIEVEELLKECRLPLSLHGSAPVDEVRWASTARQYAATIEQLIQKFKMTETEVTFEDDLCSFPLIPAEWDKAKFDNVRILPTPSTSTTSTTPLDAKAKKSLFQLQVRPASNLALLTKAGNALVVPTLEYLVILPNAMFQPKDYRNGRYFYKRNVVVQQFAKYLVKKSKVVGRVFWRLDQGDTKRPMLLLYPPSSSSTTAEDVEKADKSTRKRSRSSTATNTASSSAATGKIRFRMALSFVMESAEWMPTPLRLLPDRSNLGSDAPTPHYNQSLAWESCQVVTHAMLSGDAHHNHNDSNDDNDEIALMMTAVPNVQQALVLIQVWSLQRGLVRGHDTWSPTIMSLMVLYLLRTRRCHARMSPLQIVTALFQFIRDTDWLGGGEQQQPLSQPNSDAAMSTNKNNSSSSTTITQGLLRSSPSEGYQSGGWNRAQFVKRAALVLPLPGKTAAQTIEQSSMTQLFQQQQQQPKEKSPDSQTRSTTSTVAATVLECYQHFTSGPILLDPTMTVNYLYRLSPSFVRQWQYQASHSLHLLHGVPRPLVPLFTTSARFWTCHDLFCYISPWESLSIPSSSSHHSKPDDDDTSSPPLHHAPLIDEVMVGGGLVEDIGAREAVLRRLDALLRRALGDRIQSLRTWTTGNSLVSDSSSSRDGRLGEDSDEIPTHAVLTRHSSTAAVKSNSTSTTTSAADRLVLGFTLNPDTCHRLVDRGPPADDTIATQNFLQLWGAKAQLRRFQDGAIVNAVVWNNDDGSNNNKNNQETTIPVALANDDRTQGGIVQKIVRHIISLHFTKHDNKENNKNKNKTKKMKSSQPFQQLLQVHFSLPHLLSVVDGVKSSTSSSGAESKNQASQLLLRDPIAAHRQILNAYEALSSFLRTHSVPTLLVPGTVDQKKSRLGLPLAIDAVEPLSPALRYSELFPPLPHLSLGDTTFSLDGKQQVASGAIMSDPILIQIRFGQSSKWPADLQAIAAAKTAMLIQLANGIDDMKQQQAGGRDLCAGFHPQLSSLVTPTYLDLRFKGYQFRVVVRADPELNLLRNLQKPSPEAASLLRTLTKEHVVASMHHSTIHAVHTMDPSSSAVVRLAKRWMAAHMLSGLIPIEAIELLVAKVYADPSNTSLGSPTTAVSGFMRFLHLLSTHDWARQPLIVNPQGHLSQADCEAITFQFEQARGSNYEHGPPMYIVSPNDRQDSEFDTFSKLDTESKVKRNQPTDKTAMWIPTFTRHTPEWVVLSRAATLAARTYEFLQKTIVTGERDKWSAVFIESATSFQAYNVLLRVDTDFVVDTESSSTGGDLSVRSNSEGKVESSYTRSLRLRYLGPKSLRRKAYRNLQGSEDDVLLGWKPTDDLVAALREKLTMAVVFYNELTPQIIAILWRPTCFTRHPFSVMSSENTRPVEDNEWKPDSLVSTNTDDILREVSQLSNNLVTAIKVIERS